MKYRHGGFVFGNASAYQKLRKFSTCAGKIIFKSTSQHSWIPAFAGMTLKSDAVVLELRSVKSLNCELSFSNYAERRRRRRWFQHFSRYFSEACKLSYENTSIITTPAYPFNISIISDVSLSVNLSSDK